MRQPSAGSSQVGRKPSPLCSQLLPSCRHLHLPHLCRYHAGMPAFNTAPFLPHPIAMQPHHAALLPLPTREPASYAGEVRYGREVARSGQGTPYPEALPPHRRPDQHCLNLVIPVDSASPSTLPLSSPPVANPQPSTTAAVVARDQMRLWAPTPRPRGESRPRRRRLCGRAVSDSLLKQRPGEEGKGARVVVRWRWSPLVLPLP